MGGQLWLHWAAAAWSCCWSWPSITLRVRGGLRRSIQQSSPIGEGFLLQRRGEGEVGGGRDGQLAHSGSAAAVGGHRAAFRGVVRISVRSQCSVDCQRWAAHRRWRAASNRRCSHPTSRALSTVHHHRGRGRITSWVIPTAHEPCRYPLYCGLQFDTGTAPASHAGTAQRGTAAVFRCCCLSFDAAMPSATPHPHGSPLPYPRPSSHSPSPPLPSLPFLVHAHPSFPP